MSSSDRRRFPRYEKQIDFYCYVNGQRFDSSSVDMSRGGAYLETNDEPQPHSLVVIVPKALRTRQSAVALVGAVRRSGAHPVRGVGVEWLRCVSRRGMQDVYVFLSEFLDIQRDAVETPSTDVTNSNVAAYNFRTESFYVPDIPYASERGILVGPLPGDPEPKPPADSVRNLPLNKGPEQGIVTGMLATSGGRVPVDFPVKMILGDSSYEGKAKALGTKAILVAIPDDLEQEGAMVVLHFPVPMKEETTWVRMLCAVMKLDTGPELGYRALDLRIVEMLYEKRPGLFDRFVRYLCHRMLTR
jgi:hypothetical protein